MLTWIKNMKLWKKIVLVILLLFIIACAVVVVWQRNNIRAVIQTVSYSEEEIANKLDEAKKNFEDEAKNQYPLIVRDFTAEEERQIMKGELTVEEAMARLTEEYNTAVENYRQDNSSNSDTDNTDISANTDSSTASSAQGKKASTKKDDKKTGSSASGSKNTSVKNGDSKSNTSKTDPKSSGSKNTSNKNSNSGKTSNTNKSTSGKNSSGSNTSGKNSGSTASNDVNEIVGDQIIELYSIKAYYLGQLGQLEASARQDYAALPPEQRNSSGLKALAGKYIGQANALLGQCDAKVSSLVGNLKSELQAQGADTSIIQTILSTYENEKALKKAYYMKLIGN